MLDATGGSWMICPRGCYLLEPLCALVLRAAFEFMKNGRTGASMRVLFYPLAGRFRWKPGREHGRGRVFGCNFQREEFF